jgi:LysM repeat protein
MTHIIMENRPMRLSICLCVLIAVVTSACNLSTSSSEITPTTNDIELIIPSLPPTQNIPTRTTFPLTVESNNTTSNASPIITETVICNKQTDWDTYTVIAGDTMFGIAQRGNTTVETLVSANCLVDAGLISVGQVLYVPSPIQSSQATNTSDPLDPNRYTLQLWWIIKGDEGRTGFPVGCGDSIYLRQSGIPVNLSMDETVKRAFEYLTDNNNAGNSWSNPLSATSLNLDSYSINGDHVTANFSGQPNLSGICFDAQLEPQIALNIMSVTQTKSATIYVNGENLRDIFDMSGINTKTTYTWDEIQYPETQTEQEFLQFWVISEVDAPSNGIQVGCEGYIVPIKTSIVATDNTSNDMKTALNTLLAPNQQLQVDHTNYLLDEQNLFVENVSIEDGHATVLIGGDLYGWGACADPIFEAQIIQTIFQFEDIQSATVMNGELNLRQFVDMSGLPDAEDHVYTR